ncbi:hypothetical protein P3T23_008672 [Paraburkholderia sp. GAS448]
MQRTCQAAGSAADAPCAGRGGYRRAPSVCGRLIHADATGHNDGATQHILRAACRAIAGRAARNRAETADDGRDVSRDANVGGTRRSTPQRGPTVHGGIRPLSTSLWRTSCGRRCPHDLAWILPLSERPATMPAYMDVNHPCRIGHGQLQDNGVPSFNQTSGCRFLLSGAFTRPTGKGNHDGNGQGHSTQRGSW